MEYTFSNDIGLYIYIFSNEKVINVCIFHGEFKVMKKPSKISGPFHAKVRSIFRYFCKSSLKDDRLYFYFNLTVVIHCLKSFFQCRQYRIPSG